MSIENKCQKLFLVFFLLMLFIPSILLSENRSTSHASITLDTSLINEICPPTRNGTPPLFHALEYWHESLPYPATGYLAILLTC